MDDLASMPREQLEQLLRNPMIGDVMKSRIRDALAGIDNAEPEGVPIQTLRAPLMLTVPWSALASDNLRKGVAGDANREKHARYKVALEKFRNHVIDQHGHRPYAGPLQLLALFWFPDRRVRDPWNFQKEILDGLKGLAIVDDRWPELRRVTFEGVDVDVDRPRCEITIQPYTVN